LGLLLSLIGDDPITGTIRYTFGWIYLWDGLQLVPLTVGLFAIGELLEYGIERTSISQQDLSGIKLQWSQVWEGAAYVFKRFGLTVRCSLIGMLVGAVPGIGGVVAAFIAYGHAKQTSRNPEEFGNGSPEGVLAPEAADNAKEGGALIPTIGFGIPGSAAMALILAAFMILGIKPGPEMLTNNLSLTFTIVWTLVIANVVGAILVLSWVPIMAKVTNLRPGILVPLVLILSLLGASSRGYPEDVLLALFFGVIGYVMRLMDLPRAPVILGFVLGRTFEINLHLTLQLFGPGFLLKRPIALVLAVIIIITVTNEILTRYRRERRQERASAS
jgi:putative tricarboxylic transport membrane protein